MVKIKSVDKNSRAALAGIAAGDILISVNGHEINDVLDYGFYLAERNVEIKLTRGGEVFIIKIKKGVYDDVGLNFETPLMDKK
ncbi:MAG: PDZ domain-containing protein, partial [Firmicutes bacterium]|nr:PDZ domain-containing protein [Bacillota bacterium]